MSCISKIFKYVLVGFLSIQSCHISYGAAFDEKSDNASVDQSGLVDHAHLKQWCSGRFIFNGHEHDFAKEHQSQKDILTQHKEYNIDRMYHIKRNVARYKIDFIVEDISNHINFESIGWDPRTFVSGFERSNKCRENKQSLDVIWLDNNYVMMSDLIPGDISQSIHQYKSFLNKIGIDTHRFKISNSGNNEFAGEMCHSETTILYDILMHLEHIEKTIKEFQDRQLKCQGIIIHIASFLDMCNGCIIKVEPFLRERLESYHIPITVMVSGVKSYTEPDQHHLPKAQQKNTRSGIDFSVLNSAAPVDLTASGDWLKVFHFRSE